MRYTVLVGTETINIDVDWEVLADVRATIEGRHYRLKLQEVEPGLFWFTRDGASVEVDVSVHDNDYEVRINGHRLDLEILDRRALLERRSTAERSTGTEVRTPMPGKVVRILVHEGDRVDANQGLLVIEAMKMQNEMRAPGRGKVERIAVAEGDTVSAGALLVVVD